VQIPSDYVHAEDYARVRLHNAELMQELNKTREVARKAKEDAELANEAFRKLAGWAYIERLRLLGELARVKSPSADGCAGSGRDMSWVPRDVLNSAGSGWRNRVNTILSTIGIEPGMELLNNMEHGQEGNYAPPELTRLLQFLIKSMSSLRRKEESYQRPCMTEQTIDWTLRHRGRQLFWGSIMCVIRHNQCLTWLLHPQRASPL
jgi:hypothetical protein